MSVLGNCSLHGLSERKTYQILYGEPGEPGAYILQQLEDDVSVQTVREL